MHGRERERDKAALSTCAAKVLWCPDAKSARTPRTTASAIAAARAISRRAAEAGSAPRDFLHYRDASWSRWRRRGCHSVSPIAFSSHYGESQKLTQDVPQGNAAPHQPRLQLLQPSSEMVHLINLCIVDVGAGVRVEIAVVPQGGPPGVLGPDEFYACFKCCSIRGLIVIKKVCRAWRSEARRLLCDPAWQARHSVDTLLRYDCPDAGVLQRLERRDGRREAVIASKKDGRTPLHLAAMLNPARGTAAVAALLRLNPTAAMRPDTKDVRFHHGRLPLHLALIKKEGAAWGAALIQALVDAAPQALRTPDRYTGNDDDSGAFGPNGDPGFLPLHYAIMSHAPLEVVRLLVPQGHESSVDACDGVKFRNALHWAASRQADATMMHALVRWSPRSPRVFDHMHGQPIETLTVGGGAFDFEFDDCCDDTPEESKLALHLAVMHGSSAEAIEVLLEAHEGALYTPDGRGRLPIHLALLHLAQPPTGHRLQVVRLLLHRWPESARQPGGENLETTDIFKANPLELARRAKNLLPNVMRDVMLELENANSFEGPPICFKGRFDMGLSEDEERLALQRLSEMSPAAAALHFAAAGM